MGWSEVMLLGNAQWRRCLVQHRADLVIWNDAFTSGRLGTFVTAKVQESAA